jgi:hypothetical protein
VDLEDETMGEVNDETGEYIAIRRLQDSYADVVSRRAFSELRGLFLPAAPVLIELPGGTREVIGPDDFGRFIEKRIGDLAFFQFVILNSVVEVAVDGDATRARARTHMCELSQRTADGQFTVLYGLYRDEYARSDGRWWFAHRRFSPLAVKERGLEVFGYPDLGTGR